MNETRVNEYLGKGIQILSSKPSDLFLAGRQAQILILEILNVFPCLKFSPSLILNPAVSGKHFKTASIYRTFLYKKSDFVPK